MHRYTTDPQLPVIFVTEFDHPRWGDVHYPSPGLYRIWHYHYYSVR